MFDRAPAPPAALPQADRLAPAVSRFSLSPKRARGRSARVRFTLSEPAAVRIVIERTRPGKRRVVRTLSLSGHAGANTARLRLRARGRYRATITATDGAGNRSAARRAGLPDRAEAGPMTAVEARTRGADRAAPPRARGRRRAAGALAAVGRAVRRRPGARDEPFGPVSRRVARVHRHERGARRHRYRRDVRRVRVHRRRSAGARHRQSERPGPAGRRVPRGQSHDGSYAIFETTENLLDSDTDADTEDVYERLPSGALIHVSDDPTGTDDDGTDAHSSRISSDGSRVYFETAERLATTDTDDSADVYELGPAGLRHVSDGPGAIDDDVDAGLAALSDDGARVYFETSEALAGTDTDHAQDTYLRTADGGLVHISDDPTGADAEEHTYVFGASADGARVWFSTSESLADTDTDSAYDVYEGTPAGALSHVTRDPSGAEDEVDAALVWTSRDGARLAFETAEPMAASDGDTAVDVYVRTAAGLTHVSDAPSAADGDVDAVFADASGDGSRVLFWTDERLAATDTDAVQDVYERAPGGGLVHVSDDPTGPDDELAASDGAISRDGTRVVFGTGESLAATDADGAYDAYELGPAGLRHLTDDPTGPDAELDVAIQGSTRDLSRVYFGTEERLSAADTDAAQDVYVSALVPDPPAPPPSGSPAGPRPDTTAPRLTRLRVSKSVIRFTLSEPARVRIALQRGGRARGGFTVSGHAGANRVRLRGRRLASGRYRLTATPRDRAGNTGRARRTTFLLARRVNR